MSPMLRGQFTVTEGYTSVQFISADGVVNLHVNALDPIPRVGETIDLGDGALFVVEHVRWQFGAGGSFTSGRSTARILLAPTSDPFGEQR